MIVSAPDGSGRRSRVRARRRRCGDPFDARDGSLLPGRAASFGVRPSPRPPASSSRAPPGGARGLTVPAAVIAVSHRRAGTGPAPRARGPRQAAARQPSGRSSLERRRRAPGAGQPVTGSLLVSFDPARLDVRALLIAVRRHARLVDERTNGHRAPTDAWHQLPASEVMTRLSTPGSRGLSTGEAESRLAIVGANRLPTPEPKSSLRDPRRTSQLAARVAARRRRRAVARGRRADRGRGHPGRRRRQCHRRLCHRAPGRARVDIPAEHDHLRALVRRDGVETTVPAAASRAG